MYPISPSYVSLRKFKREMAWHLPWGFVHLLWSGTLHYRSRGDSKPQVEFRKPSQQSHKALIGGLVAKWPLGFLQYVRRLSNCFVYNKLVGIFFLSFEEHWSFQSFWEGHKFLCSSLSPRWETGSELNGTVLLYAFIGFCQKFSSLKTLRGKVSFLSGKQWAPQMANTGQCIEMEGRREEAGGRTAPFLLMGGFSVLNFCGDQNTSLTQ